MHRPKKTYAFIMLSAAMLSQGFALDVYGASTTGHSVSKSVAAAASSFTLDKLGSVPLKQNVSVELTEMDIFTQPDGNILVYTLRYRNSSGSRVDLIDYFSQVTTPSGTSVKGKNVTSDAAKRTVPHEQQPIRDVLCECWKIDKGKRNQGFHVRLGFWQRELSEETGAFHHSG